MQDATTWLVHVHLMLCGDLDAALHLVDVVRPFAISSSVEQQAAALIHQVSLLPSLLPAELHAFFPRNCTGIHPAVLNTKLGHQSET